MNSSSIISVLLWAIPVILAITLHEAAHGYVARIFGDPTAHEAGRITLNPLRHIDPVGTLLVPGMILVSNLVTGIQLPAFGWAKPVPVNFGRLRHPKQDMLWVAIAGPASNLAQAIVWACIGSVALHGGMMTSLDDNSIMAGLVIGGVIVNLWLMLINLIPVPPLDGGRVLVSVLPVRYAWQLSRLEPYGFIILIALLYFHALDWLHDVALVPVAGLIFTLTGS